MDKYINFKLTIFVFKIGFQKLHSHFPVKFPFLRDSRSIHVFAIIGKGNFPRWQLYRHFLAIKKIH